MKISVPRFACALLLCFGACAKKEPKPLRTEPWLAHPPPSSSSALSDAATPAVRYALTGQSVIHLELSTKRGTLRGNLTRVRGELSLNPGDLARSQARVDADLDSFSLQSGDASDESAWRARIASALELSDAGASSAHASFELTALEDAVPPLLEPAPATADGAAPFTRRARATAVGNLRLHGFRVVRRVPIDAELGFTGDRSSPSSVSIRSRVPFVVSLETHAIRIALPHSGASSSERAPERSPDLHVTIELYGTKID